MSRALLLAIAFGAAPAARGEEAYTFSVVPQFEQRKLFSIWKPLLDELEKRTGFKLNLVGTADIPEFERRVEEKRFDFIYTNPYLVVREKSSGYIPLVHDAEPLRGILVVAKDSPVREVKDLDGKLLAVPSPNALGASMLLRSELKRVYHISMRLLNARSHSSVYLHVVNGLADAGGGVEKTLREQKPAIRENLRILYSTGEVPSHPIAAHPRVPEAAREKLRSALFELAATPRGKTLLSAIPMTRPTSTSLQDFLPMAQWHLEHEWIDAPP